MYITLIAKRKEYNGKAWYVYNTYRRKTWYNVSFNKDVPLPQIYQIGKTNILRAFIDLQSPDQFDIKDVNGHKTIYVNSHFDIPDDQIKRLKLEELTKYNEYKEKQEREKWSFLRNDDDIDIPF